MEKYKNNIAYLFKKKDNIKGATPNREWETEGIPFYCNVEQVSKSILNPITGMYKKSSARVIKTTTKLQRRYGVDFAEFDRIAFTKTPSNDVNNQDYDLIESVELKPFLEIGNKHRNDKYYEYWIRTS